MVEVKLVMNNEENLLKGRKEWMGMGVDRGGWERGNPIPPPQNLPQKC